MFDRSVCTGDWGEVDNGLKSFPSGHTTSAFAGFVYMSLWLNAKLKVWSNYHPAFWKMIAVWAPILGATLIGGALTIDEHHNWWDVVAGAVIGTFMSFSSYRMVYAAIFDFRYNHIPLLRTVPFRYGEEHGGFEDAMWVRKAGWGSGTAVTSGRDGLMHRHGHQHNHHDTSGTAAHGAGHRVEPYESV